jgi:hypothetical protein
VIVIHKLKQLLVHGGTMHARPTKARAITGTEMLISSVRKFHVVSVSQPESPGQAYGTNGDL